MKNKIIAIVLTLAGVAALCLPLALPSATIQTEEVILEEASENPTWDVLYKNDSTTVNAYQEILDNIAKQQEEIQANTQATEQSIQDAYNQLFSSELGKLIQANNEKVVKDISSDNKGNLVVKYSNGTQKNISIYDVMSNSAQAQDADAAAQAQAEVLQAQAEALAAAQAAASIAGTVINCKDGACMVNAYQLQKIHATWDFAGDAIEMAGHHSIAELEAVIGPVIRK